MSIDLHDLLVFFEAEPKTDESDVPWEYSGVQVTFESAKDEVRCSLAPGEGGIAVVWRESGIKRLELSLTGYFDMKIENIGGVERLVAISDKEDQPPFVLQLRPHVFVALGAA